MKSNILRTNPLRLATSGEGYSTLLGPSGRSSYVHEFIRQIIIVNTTESSTFVSMWKGNADPGVTPPTAGQAIFNKVMNPGETVNIYYSPGLRLYTSNDYLIAASADTDTVTVTVCYEQMLLDLFYID